MPIILPNDLPAPWILEAEAIAALTSSEAARQDIRPLRVLLIDLLPHTLSFAGPVARFLANSPLQIHLTIAHLDDIGGLANDGGVLPGSRAFRSLLDERYDALVVSDLPGDPLRGPTWDALRDALDWSLDHVHAAFYLGGSAAAGLAHFYGITPRPLTEPLVGLHTQRIRRRQSYLLRGLDEAFVVPVRRQWTLDEDDLADVPWLEILADSPTSGPYLVRNRSRRQVFATNLPTHEPVHLRADLKAAGKEPGREEDSRWRAHAQVLFGNWLNNYVYQSSPHELEQLVPLAIPWIGGRKPHQSHGNPSAVAP